MSKRLVWLRPFLESGAQPDQLCCMVFINKWPHRMSHNSIHEQCAPFTGEHEFSKLAHSSSHRSIQHQVCTTCKRKLDFQHSMCGVLVRTCVFVFHQSAPRSSHSSTCSNTSTAPRREPKHNKHNKFHTKLIQQHKRWWFDLLAP